jgi:hypothetical protein
MNDILLVFQYLMEALDAGPTCRFTSPKLTLSYGISTVEIDGNDLVVRKTVSQEKFNVADPQCAEKIVQFIGQSEGSTTAITFDGWHRVVSDVKLREAAEKAKLLINAPSYKELKYGGSPELRQVYDDLMNVSWPLEVSSDEGTDIWLDRGADAWRDLFEYLEME